MPAEPNEDNIRDHLIALGDGELDTTDTAAVWEYLAASPATVEHLRFMHDQQRLTLVARRALREPLPERLRTRVDRLVHQGGTAARAPHRFRWRAAVAVAAGILLGVSGGAFYRTATRDAPVVPAQVIADVSRVHSECARLPDDLHDATFESVDAGLAARTLSDLGGKSAAPDLTQIGYRLVGAGPCPAAKFDTVHILYHNEGARPYHAVSLFVQADHGQYERLRPGHVYRVSTADMPFPVLAWRGHGVLYFLLADNDSAEAAALQAVRPTPANDIVTVAAG